MTSVLMLLEFQFPHDDRVEKEALTLLEMGFSVVVLCPDFSGHAPHETYKGIEITRFRVRKNTFKKLLGLCQIFPFYYNMWRRQVKHLLKEREFGVLHIHDLPLCKLGAWFKKHNNMAFIADMHENYPAMVSGQEHIKKFPNNTLISIRRWYELEKKWLLYADHIVCTAPGMIDRLKNTLGTGKSFALIPNTIHPEAFMASQQRDEYIEKKYKDKFVMLYYGGISEQRGIQNMIEAVPKLSKEIVNLKVVIVGAGSYLHSLKLLAKELDTEGHIDFEGWKPQSTLASYMKNTSVAVIPHLKSEHTDNTSPNKIFMFMYFGKPTLATNCNYLVNLIEETESGLIYESGNSHDFADKALKLYWNPELRERLGENARKSLYKKYYWNLTVGPLRKIYQLYLT